MQILIVWENRRIMADSSSLSLILKGNCNTEDTLIRKTQIQIFLLCSFAVAVPIYNQHKPFAL